MGFWGVGRRKPWNLGGSESCSAGKAKTGRGVGEGDMRVGEAETQTITQEVTTVKPPPLGESSWLELRCSLDVGQRASLQPPDLASSCSQLHTQWEARQLPLHWLHFRG